MEFFKTTFLLFVINTGFYTLCVACGGRVEYTAQTGYIQSPNFWKEYGEEANCTWEFNDINKNYGLALTLIIMRMYYYDVRDAKQCGNSYRLTVNGERVDCMLDIVPGRNARHYSFYTNPSCTTVECGLECNNWIKIVSTSIKIEYFADGSKPMKGGSNAMWGFKMEYDYVNCPTGQYSNTGVLEIASITTALATTVNPATSLAINTTSLKATTAQFAMDTDSNIDARSAMIGAGITVAIIVAVFNAVLLAWVLVKKMRRKGSKHSTQGDDVIRMKNDLESVEYANATEPASQAVYCEVTMPSQGQSPHVAISNNQMHSLRNNDGTILIETPGYEPIEFDGQDQDEGDYVEPLVLDS